MAKIIRSESIGITDVYDIAMPNIHNFIADGIVVHNCDLPSRDLLVGKDKRSGYLYGRWGDKAAQISTRTTIRLKSAILDANRYVKGSVEESIASFSKGLPAPPQGVSDGQFIFGFEDDDGNHVPGLIEVSEDLKKYSETRPEEWGIVSKAMGLTRAFSRHASAFVISNVPIQDVIPTKEGNITQYEAKAVEEAGLIKYDFLVIKVLKDMEVCLKLINKKNNENKKIGYFTHEGKELYIWDLPELKEVFQSIWGGSTETLWQINTKSMIPYVIEMLPGSIMDLATLLALVRPGPLDFINEATGRNMTQEYMLLRRGESQPDIKEMAEVLPETFGVLCIKEGSKVKTEFGPLNIEDVKRGTLIQTEDGSYQKVLANLNKGISKTITIRSDNAEELTVTPDHKILTNRGWLCAKDITDRDLIAHRWASDDKIEEGNDIDWIIGLLLADGDFANNSTPTIAAGKDRKIAEEIKHIVDNAFGIDSKIYFNVRCWYVKLSANRGPFKNSNPVTKLLRDLNISNKICSNKTFPYKITKNMIMGFIEGDGSVYNQRIRIKNKNMARSIFETLQALRIKSSLHEDEKDIWSISFDRNKFNFKLTIKQYVRPSKGLNYPRPKWKLPRSDSNRGNFNNSMISKIPFMSESVLRRIANKYNFTFDFDKTWSKVLSIKEDKEYQVYDLSVENVHSFVVGGCVVHNCFQEQLGKIARDLAGFSGEDAELLRENMAKKKLVELMKMKPAFLEGAKKKVSEEVAEAMWERMVTFGRYGFSIIHAVEYGLTTYASMFLKHFYPLEWWCAVLTNAEEKEITTKFWPYVKDIVSPPDINLSKDTMVVDYENQKIRAKLGIIRGMGEKTIDPIVNGRPYADIQDYVNKGVAGESLSHKLIHVGILDSLFPPKLNLIEKLKMYQQAIENKVFADKMQKAKESGKKMKSLAPKEGIVPLEYMGLHPLKDASMRKAVLPSIPIDLFELGALFSKASAGFSDRPALLSSNNHRTMLVTGEQLKRLDELDGHFIQNDIYVAVTGYIVGTAEFSYAKNTKRALKINLDAGNGFIKEFVLWPNYETGTLLYSSALKKGAIASIFFRKKQGKKDLNITEIIIEIEA